MCVCEGMINNTSELQSSDGAALTLISPQRENKPEPDDETRLLPENDVLLNLHLIHQHCNIALIKIHHI